MVASEPIKQLKYELFFVFFSTVVGHQNRAKKIEHRIIWGLVLMLMLLCLCGRTSRAAIYKTIKLYCMLLPFM